MPSIAGPKRPQDRVLVAHAKQGFREALRDFVSTEELAGWDESVDESFPGLRRPESRRRANRASRMSTARTFPPTSADRASRCPSPWQIEHRSISTTVQW